MHDFIPITFVVQFIISILLYFGARGRHEVDSDGDAHPSRFRIGLVTDRETGRYRTLEVIDPHGVSNATANRALEVVRRILNVAHQDWRWLKGVPKIRMLKEPRRRVRFLRREEADRLIEALHEHMKPIVEFALATGCRAGEILGLEWNRVAAWGLAKQRVGIEDFRFHDLRRTWPRRNSPSWPDASSGSH